MIEAFLTALGEGLIKLAQNIATIEALRNLFGSFAEIVYILKGIITSYYFKVFIVGVILAIVTFALVTYIPSIAIFAISTLAFLGITAFETSLALTAAFLVFAATAIIGMLSWIFETLYRVINYNPEITRQNDNIRKITAKKFINNFLVPAIILLCSTAIITTIVFIPEALPIITASLSKIGIFMSQSTTLVGISIIFTGISALFFPSAEKTFDDYSCIEPIDNTFNVSQTPGTEKKETPQQTDELKKQDSEGERSSFGL